MVSADERAPVAVVGMAALFPGAADLDAYWRNLVEGVDAITDLPADYGLPAARFAGGRGGFLGELATVDVLELGVMPSAVPWTEPDQLIALHVAAGAVADAGGPRVLGDRDRTAVILGRGGYLTAGLARIDLRARVGHQLVHTLAELLPELDQDRLDRVLAAFTDALGPADPGAQIGLVPNLAASRVANRLGLGGPAYTVDAACASSLIAVDHAVTELRAGRCDAVLAGGVHHGHDATLWSVFAELGALSRTGGIRPFAADADGLLIGEGTGVVVLKRLADARRDGDRVYAVVRGTGVASDGGGVSLMHPAVKGQVLAVRRAWAAAGLDPAEPASLGLLEAHGTATPAGDAAELATLREVFGGPQDSAPAVIGSVKSMIGHTMPAAGIAGLIKAALAVHHGTLPPTLHCAEPSPALAATRFRPLDTAREWTGEGPRRAAVNAFGFGGISAHVILEQDHAPRVTVHEPVKVLRLSAKDPGRLAELLDSGTEPLPASSAADVCRLAVVEPTPRKLATVRRVLAAGRPWRGRGDIWFSPRPLLRDPAAKLAFVHPGLEADFAPAIADVAQRFGLPLPQLKAGDVGRHGTAVVAVGRLLDTALRRLSVTPDLVAGHSVGEWTAMATAGMYDEAELEQVLSTFDPDGFQVPDLVFAALGRGAAHILPELAAYPEITLSHDNSPHQCVVCGPAEQVDELLAALLEERVMGRRLPFRSGFHTPRLAPYLAQIEKDSDRLALRPPAVPVWSATTAAPYPDDPDEVRALFHRHLLETVRFRPMIERMYTAGTRVFVQVGPGQLGTVISDVLQGREHLAVAANSARQTGLGQLARVTAALWTEGGTPSDELITPRPSAPGRPVRLVRLALGGPVVTLGAAATGLIGRTAVPTTASPAVPTTAPAVPTTASPAVPTTASPAVPTAAPAVPTAAPAVPTAASAVFAVSAADGPVPRELAALLAETEEAARAVLAAATRRERGTDDTREFSLTAQPHLRDHSFFQVPAGWPDEHDRFPVVPATELVRQMTAAAENACPGQIAVAVHDARFERWLAVEPPVRVRFTVVPLRPGRVRVVVQGHAHAEVELAARRDTPPRAAPPPARTERKPLLTAEELYSRRWMFHGPAYQGVSDITAIGERHVRGVITAPAAPGGLLDNAGHLVGYWILEQFERNSRVFPVRFGRIRQFQRTPRPGERLDCLVEITSVTEDAVTADIQLIRPDGTLWVHVHGWQVHRFASDEKLRALERDCAQVLLADRHGEWFAVHETWPDLASREIMARHFLGAQEWAQYERQSPRTRRQWLLGRMALKDAVRARLLGPGRGVFPVEVAVGNDAGGRPFVRGRHGRVLPELDVSLSHRFEVGVAIARPAAGGVGIDVLDVTDHARSTMDVACGRPERELLAGSAATTGEPESLWFTRFFAAKEAAAKADGTGLRGRPDRFEVTAVDHDRLWVRTPERTHRLAVAPLRHGTRDYVVAWTLPRKDET
ncbi:beta-ketoacyl synthase N-terminal-like domain-containing protein [Streptomyces sp. NPDC093094]|uniref:beta-ketoacyl synthase N-terminal-like domain-containing protein n=1 Tax=Streptomyces sp. NPDC093094 TaxID=3366026 RepID=UPI0037F97D9D